MKRGPLLAGLLTLGACGPGPVAETPVSSPRAAVGDDLSNLADALDPGPIAPVWSTLPEAFRRDLEGHAPKATSNVDRLSLADDRLLHDGFSIDVDADADTHETVRGHLEALYLLEPIAFGPVSRERHQAARLLARFWSVASRFERIGAGAAVNGYTRGDPALDPDVLARLAELSDRQSRGLLARSIREDKTPPVDLKDVAFGCEEREDIAGARRLWAVAVAHDVPMRADDWLTVARLALAEGDARTIDTSVAKALAVYPKDRALIAEPELVDLRQTVAAVRELEKKRARVDTLRAAAVGTTLDAQLARAEVLFETGKKREAQRIWGSLPKTDARVRLRLSQASLANMSAKETFPSAVERAIRMLDGPEGPEVDAAHRSWTVGLVGTKVMFALASLPEPPQREAYVRDKLLPLVAELTHANDALAKLEPGRAAAIAFVAEQATEALGPAGRATWTLGDLETRSASWLPRLEALVTTYPRTRDLYRLLYAAAPFVSDPKKARALLSRIPEGDDGTPGVAVQRATVATMLAATSLDRASIELARSAAEAIPESESVKVESLREVLRADVEAIDATAKTDARHWRRAMDLYESARAATTSVRPRVTHNLAFVLAQQGLTHEAHELFAETAKTSFNRRWVTVLGNAVALSTDRSQILDVLKEMEKELESGQRPVPMLVEAWRAALDPDPAARKLHAKRFLVQRELVRAKLKLPRAHLGMEIEGSFSVGIRVAPWGRSRLHLFDATYDGVVWLTPKPPLSEAELEKLAR